MSNSLGRSDLSAHVYIGALDYRFLKKKNYLVLFVFLFQNDSDRRHGVSFHGMIEKELGVKCSMSR